MQFLTYGLHSNQRLRIHLNLCQKLFSQGRLYQALKYLVHNIQIQISTGTEELKTSKIIFCPDGMSAYDNPMKMWPYHNVHTASFQTPSPRAVLSREVSG